jgi:hypothetical protein
LQALLTEALPFTAVSDSTQYGKRRVVRVAYRLRPSWQQVATLLAALKTYDDARFETVVIQGVHTNDQDSYLFTNGQLQFDRNARLGSQFLKRYQIETGNGYTTDSIRLVLSE